MVQIIEAAPKKPKFLEQLMGGVQQATSQGIPQVAQHLMGQRQQQGENQAIQRLMGHDVSGLSPELKKTFVEKSLAQQGKKPNLAPAISAIKEMESLMDRPGVGLFSGANFSSEARTNRAKFETLQASLMPLFKGMFPRGMTEKEFKVVMDQWIPQPHDSAARIKGKIEGLKQLMAEQEGGMPNMGAQGGKSGATEMRDSKGNVYDIPQELVEQARAQGLL